MKAIEPESARQFLELLRPIERELENYCRRLAWNRADVPDALQNALLRGVAAFDRYHADASFKAWMFRILTNEVFNLNRKHSRIARREFQLEPEELEQLCPAEGSLAGQDWLAQPGAFEEALDDRLVEALRLLTDPERAVLLLRAIGGLRYREIGEALEIPIGSVMGYLARARAKLKIALSRRNFPQRQPRNP